MFRSKGAGWIQRRGPGGVSCAGRCGHQSHSWKAVIRIAGREYTKSYARKADAEAWLVGMRGQKALVESGRQAAPVRTRKSRRLADIHEEVAGAYETGVLTGRRLTTATLRSYRSELALLVGEFPNVPLQSITESTVDDYHGVLARRGLSASAIRRRLDRLAQALEWSVRRGYIPAVPCKIRRPAPAPKKEVVVAPEWWIEYMLVAATVIGTEYASLVLLLADAGLRRSEPWLLRRRDVVVRPRPDDRGSWGAIRLEVRGTEERTKSGRARTIPILSERLAGALRFLAGDDDERLLPSLRGRETFHARHDKIRRMMRLVWRRAGLAGWTGHSEPQFHALRHRFGTWVLEEGLGTIVEVQAWMGHSVITTTQRYLHVRTGPKKRPGSVHWHEEKA